MSATEAGRRANELRTGPLLRRRRRQAAIFRVTTALMTLSGVLFLLLLLFQVVRDAWGWLDWQFLTSFPSRRPAVAGVKSDTVVQVQGHQCLSSDAGAACKLRPAKLFPPRLVRP